MKVEDILRIKGTKVLTVAPDATIEQAARMLSAARIGSLVVSTDGRKVEGLLSERDVVQAVAAQGATAMLRRVSSAMTTPVVTCRRGDRVTGLMAVMTQKRCRHLPVVEDGVLCGMVSIGDLVKARLEDLELESQVLRDAYLATH
jgi:CBS domain-containing protein